MLPWWASDIRGAFLALLITSWAKSSPTLGPNRLLTVAHRSILSACGSTLLFSLAFYAHTTRTVFNRRPTFSLRSFWMHLAMTRPLEALWRLLTFPLRVQPDFLILGEVRTGTTSLAASLRELGCQGPFSPWIVPLASDKESFYFSGHYFGFMLPEAYRMCFPLRITVWFQRRVLGRPYPIFDACASYFTAPWVAPLLKVAVAPEAAFVVLLREPVAQNVSWWKLEMGAHLWAKSMGMSQSFVLPNYPPKCFSEALELSRSDEIQALYKEGEGCGERLAAARTPLAKLLRCRLRSDLLPFPGGQLAAFDKMGRYAENLERLFNSVGRDRVLCLCSEKLLKQGGLEQALQQLGSLTPGVAQLLEACLSENSVQTDRLKLPRLNASASLPPELEPSSEDLGVLKKYYERHNERLFTLIGRDLGWNDDDA